MILVMAAGGNVGSELVRKLAARGAKFRAAYHSEEKAKRARDAGHEAVTLDYGKPDTLRESLAGIDRLFLASPATPAQPEQEGGVVEEARRMGVKRIVKLSVWRAPEESFTFARWNHLGESRVEASGIPFTFLRPNSFMQNLVNFFAGSIKNDGAFALPAGNARISHIDVRDVASAAAAVLTEEGHEGRAYDLSGPEALNYHQIAGILSLVLEKKIFYTSLADQDFKERLLGLGAPEWQANAFIDLMHCSIQGQASDVLGSIQQITGQRPLSFERFARDHRGAFS